MADIDHIEPSVCAMVRHVNHTHNAFIVQFTNGNMATVETEDPLPIIGDVILLSERSGEWEPVPDKVWPAHPSVGVIKALVQDGSAALIETGLSLYKELIPESLQVSLGQTVEYWPRLGITNIIDDKPIHSDPLRAGSHPDPAQSFELPRGTSSLSLEDFGGYEEVKARAHELIATQLEHGDILQAIGVDPVRGVIFSGTPGTGKTYLARIIANIVDAKFFLVSGPQIVSKYVGDSEETLRGIFEAAEQSERAIIFFDEIDSITSSRSEHSSESSDRIVAQLLTLLDGFSERKSQTVVLAATNRIDSVDQALLRPGRFDWEISFPPPTLRDRVDILSKISRGIRQDGHIDIEGLAVATDGWSGAELKAIWTEADLLAAMETRRAITAEDIGRAYERVNQRPRRLNS